MVTYKIDVSLPVYQALTALLEEGKTHDDVLREVLRLDSIVEPEVVSPFDQIEAVSDGLRQSFVKAAGGGFYSRRLWLPNGTKLRARYKRRLHQAKIQQDRWFDEKGHEQSSPSAAAAAITGTNVNGLRFWEALRPTDKVWRRLDVLAQK